MDSKLYLLVDSCEDEYGDDCLDLICTSNSIDDLVERINTNDGHNLLILTSSTKKLTHWSRMDWVCRQSGDNWIYREGGK